jgi:para-nitrobenzyl esterase
MDRTIYTSGGALRGSSEGGLDRFLGIPYAAAPTGDLRFRPPQPPTPWPGERDATVPGATVVKPPYPWPYNELFDEPEIPGPEMLNLNVWTPTDARGAPVFVWIHGGAFVNGSGAVPQYDGAPFARDGVVCVTINYRLGADGFLDLGDGTTNLGIRDQIAALSWVKENIEVFGGDPQRVTVGGESAGAMSVATLLASPAAEGLVHAAILQSGAGHHALSRSTAQLVASELASRLATDLTPQGFASVPVADLLSAQQQLALDIQTSPDPARWREVAANLMPFEPVTGDDIVPAIPIRRIEAGAGADIPVLIGTNQDENRLFLAPSGALKMIDEQMLRAAVVGYGFTDPDATIQQYRGQAGGSPGDTLAAIATDWFFRIPAIRLVEARHGPGAAESYMYEFRWNSPAGEGALGACHFLEIPFVFDTLDTPGAKLLTGDSAPQGLADEMHGAWVNFIKTGVPGWAPYLPQSRTVKVFDVPSTIEMDPYRERRVMWDGLR